jgi:protocatechuate 3,4-dioxygenase beta subunit
MKPDQLSDKEIIDKFDGSMAIAEKGRAEGLKKLQTLQTVKNQAQIKEHRRLQTKLGVQHPRVQHLAARIQYNEGLAEDLAVEIDKSTIEAPAIDEKSWMVHGRVMDTKSSGLSVLTVGIFDADGRWIRQAGYACTDQRGYFAIVYTPKKDAEDKTKNEVQYFLHVIGPDAKLLNKDPNPLHLVAGQIEYREIFLDRDKAVCNAPQNGKDDSDLPTCGPWVLHGKVTDVQGNPLPGMVVGVFYKEGQTEKKLGSAQTVKSGSYEVTYTAKDVKEGPDPAADLLVAVTDSNGKIVYRSEEKIVYIPGKTVVFDIRITSPPGIDKVSR